MVQAPADPPRAAAERATCVLCASLALALLYWGWRPVPATIWRLPQPAAGTARLPSPSAACTASCVIR
ncbi:MAG: hypothetical protein ACRDNF_02765 [Streptosporangiaceae bacterium]